MRETARHRRRRGALRLAYRTGDQPRLRRAAAALALVILGAASAAAADISPRLGLPLACTPGEDCFVQNYVDRDPGPQARDHACGPLTYDGHKGTDFRLRDLGAMRTGVAVIAAAAGQVQATREGMDDTGVAGLTRDAVAGRECGNGVLLRHGGGWETQYCHMRKGSIAVSRGEIVTAGRRLGLVGLSGKTEFPHLHLAVRHHGKVVDPYGGESEKNGCGVIASPLWNPDAAALLVYRPSGMLAASFSDAVPSLAEIREGRHHNSRLAARHPVLVFWAHIFGLREGDVQELRLSAPGGRVAVEKRGEPAPRNRATEFRYVGRRLEAKGWPPGIYRGEYRLTRDGEVVIEISREVELR